MCVDFIFHQENDKGINIRSVFIDPIYFPCSQKNFARDYLHNDAVMQLFYFVVDG